MAGVLQECLARSGVTTMGVRESFVDFRDNPFFGGACLGAFAIAIAAFPTIQGALVSLGVGMLLEVLMAGGLPHSIARIGIGMGLGAGVVLCARAFRREQRVLALRTFCTALMLPLFILISALFLEPTVIFHPVILDPSVMRLEATLSPTGIFDFAAFIGKHLWFQSLISAVYIFLPLACALVAAVEIVAARKPGAPPARDVLTSFAIVGFAGFVCYHLCPVIGPRPFFQGWPAVPDLELVPLADARVTLPEPRNCVPSLHTAWALIVYWHVREHGRIAHVLGLAFLGLTLCATIGLGYHYFVDLCVAFPFTLAIRAALATRAPARARHTAFAFGATIVVAWLLIIRFFVPVVAEVPAITWMLALVSLVGTVVLEARLGREREALCAERALHLAR